MCVRTSNTAQHRYKSCLPDNSWCKYKRESAKQKEQRQKREEQKKEQQKKDSETSARRSATDTSESNSDSNSDSNSEIPKQLTSQKRECRDTSSTDNDGSTDSEKPQMDEVNAILVDSKTDEVDPIYKMKCSTRWLDKSHRSYEHVKRIHDHYTQESYLKMMMHPFDTQANEAMNKRITKSCPKHLAKTKTNKLSALQSQRSCTTFL